MPGEIGESGMIQIGFPMPKNRYKIIKEEARIFILINKKTCFMWSRFGGRGGATGGIQKIGGKG
jgi:hypothetical protein